MKRKSYSEEQIISIVRENEAGLSGQPCEVVDKFEPIVATNSAKMKLSHIFATRIYLKFRLSRTLVAL